VSHHLFLSILGTEIDLETDNAEVIWMVENLYERFLASTPFTKPSVRIRCVSNGEQTGTSLANDVPLDDAKKTQLRECMSALWEAMAGGLKDHVIFHAAAVARGGFSILMLGDPESGKTTLTLALLKEGRGKFSLLAEELSVVDLRTRQIVPFPRAFTVTERTLKLFPELNPIPQRIHGTGKWIVPVNDVLDAFSVSMGGPSLLNYILLLKTGEDFKAPAKLEHLQPARAVLELCKRSLSVHSDIVTSIDIGRDLVSKAKCFQLKVGELDSTVKMVVSLIPC
jgi:hypothetical protein